MRNNSFCFRVFLLCVPLASALFLSACNSDALSPCATGRVEFLLGGEGARDTIKAASYDVEIRLLDRRGNVLRNEPFTVTAVFPDNRDNEWHSEYIFNDDNTRHYHGQAVVSTNGDGRARFTVRLAPFAGRAAVYFQAAAHGIRDSVVYFVEGGAPVRLLLQPKDTVISVGRGYTLKARVYDRFDNSLGPVTLTSRSPAVTVQSAYVSGKSPARTVIVGTATIGGITVTDSAFVTVQ